MFGIKQKIIDGTVQRFEFTFELAWRLSKALIEKGGIDSLLLISLLKLKNY